MMETDGAEGGGGGARGRRRNRRKKLNTGVRLRTLLPRVALLLALAAREHRTVLCFSRSMASRHAWIVDDSAQEAMEVDGDAEDAGAKKSLEGVTDLRELLSSRRKERPGQGGEGGGGGGGGGKGRRGKPRGRGSVKVRAEMMEED